MLDEDGVQRSEESDVQRSLGRIEGKLDSLTLQFQAALLNQSEKDSDFEHRIRSLEYMRYWYAGAASIVGCIVGFFINFFHK